MKLRIRGNSIRIRVTKSELERVAATGDVTDSVNFGPTSRLKYSLQATPAGAVAADFVGEQLTVTVPAIEIERWASTAQVSIVGEQSLAGGESLNILVEKDFQCLEPRPDEDSKDFFVNPAKDDANA